MIKLQSLLLNSKKFLKLHSDIITLNKKNIVLLGNELKNKDLKFKEEKIFSKLPFVFYLLIDSLNFCFWNFNPNKKFSYKNKFGSVAFALKIKENLKNINPDFLYNEPSKFYKLLLKNTQGELLLKEARIKIIKEVGKFLKKYDLNQVISSFENKDIDLVANFFLKNLSYPFYDVSKKEGIVLPFLKKLRLFLSDLIVLKGVNFKNKEKLLIFADYALPKLFLAKEILILNSKDKEKIIQGQVIKQNSLTEISWRAGTIVSVSILKKELEKQGLKISYQELDRKLWLYSKTIDFPFSRVLTRFY
jgi:uncharacterized protein YbcI